MLNISVLVSGGGTNLQAIIDGIESGEIPDAKIVRIVSSSEKAFALERSKKHNIVSAVIGKANYPDEKERTAAILAELSAAQTDLVVLAGYMSILPPSLIKTYEGRIINIHPSLIPKYCGMGFYGKRVHQAVLAAGEKESGATVHYVDEGVDSGPILLQRTVPVLEDDTADTLAARVLKTEHRLLLQAVKELALNESEKNGK